MIPSVVATVTSHYKADVISKALHPVEGGHPDGLDLNETDKGIFMNKLLATLVFGLVAVGAFAQGSAPVVTGTAPAATAQVGAKAEVKPAAAVDTKAGVKADAKADVKADAKTEAKSDKMAEHKAAKPAHKHEHKKAAAAASAPKADAAK